MYVRIVFNILYYFLVMNAGFVTLPAVLLAAGAGVAGYALGNRHQLTDEESSILADLLRRIKEGDFDAERVWRRLLGEE